MGVDSMIFEKISELFSHYLSKEISKDEISSFQAQFELLFDSFRDEIENEIGKVNYELLDDIYMAFDSYEPDENIRVDDKHCIDEAELLDKIREIYKKISISSSNEKSLNKGTAIDKLIYLPQYPQIQTITSVLVLQREVKIYFDDFENNKYELHFPTIYDFRQCIEEAFISRRFEAHIDDKINFAVFRVENSDWINKFISDSDGIYGENQYDYQHYIIFESVDTRIEVLATQPPNILKIASFPKEIKPFY